MINNLTMFISFVIIWLVKFKMENFYIHHLKTSKLSYLLYKELKIIHIYSPEFFFSNLLFFSVKTHFKPILSFIKKQKKSVTCLTKMFSLLIGRLWEIIFHFLICDKHKSVCLNVTLYTSQIDKRIICPQTLPN